MAKHGKYFTFGDHWRVKKDHCYGKHYGFVEDVYLFSFLIRNLVVGCRCCVTVMGGTILVSLVLENGDGPTYIIT